MRRGRKAPFPHRKWTMKDELKEIWRYNAPLIILSLIGCIIMVIIMMIGFASATEAHQYEHLSQIVGCVV